MLWLHARAGDAWEEYAAAVAGLAAQQRGAERIEWLGCAKIALQVARSAARGMLYHKDP